MTRWMRLHLSNGVLEGKRYVSDSSMREHGDSFMVHWRDPVYGEVYSTILDFLANGDTVASLRVRINRDEFTAVRAVR